jgi:hypothetical protein
MSADGSERVRSSGRGSNARTGLSIDVPHDLACGDFQLCGDGDSVRAPHARHTAAGELPGTKTGENGELERGELS